MTIWRSTPLFAMPSRIYVTYALAEPVAFSSSVPEPSRKCRLPCVKSSLLPIEAEKDVTVVLLLRSTCWLLSRLLPRMPTKPDGVLDRIMWEKLVNIRLRVGTNVLSCMLQISFM